MGLDGSLVIRMTWWQDKGFYAPARRAFPWMCGVAWMHSVIILAIIPFYSSSLLAYVIHGFAIGNDHRVIRVASR